MLVQYRGEEHRQTYTTRAVSVPTRAQSACYGGSPRNTDSTGPHIGVRTGVARRPRSSAPCTTVPARRRRPRSSRIHRREEPLPPSMRSALHARAERPHAPLPQDLASLALSAQLVSAHLVECGASRTSPHWPPPWEIVAPRQPDTPWAPRASWWRVTSLLHHDSEAS